MIFFHFIIQQTACKNLLFNETLYLFLASYRKSIIKIKSTENISEKVL
ncbi:hypothetical protein BAXH7_01586 [Bacillus amyloliquefaciens XH7]|nr:hypothetical protein BAMTA208_07790 [Bacillus amyloliquefaciens TA208]AEB63572.1 hypothetical protein LL3_02033 [Bacillus amyloliquefaciens LL3]AEK88724.1 hypothetical protein BAXH7_01586 [Bacillus amyloliquefaciens XH7]